MKEEKHRYVLTHPQQRIWYTEKLHPGTGMWNNAGTLKIKGRIDFEALERAVNMFIEDNETVRLKIGAEDGTPYQYITDYEYVKLDYMDFSEQSIKKLYEWDSAQTQAPMPLIDRDLYYFAMMKVGEDEGWLYVKFHHIISDGLSIVDFTNQVVDNYQSLLTGEQRPELNLYSYINYIKDEEEYLKSKRFIYDQEYWTKKFAILPEPSVMKQKKTNYFSTKATRKTYVLPEDMSAQIRTFCREAGISVFALFLSALAVYMNRVTGKKDIIIGAPVANRNTRHSKGAIGMYVSTVPVRIEIKDELSFTEFARVVSNQWFSVLKHQKYPYDMLMKELRKQHKGIESLYDVTLSYQIGKFEKNTEQFTYEGRWHFNGSQANSLSIHVNDREDNGKFIMDYDHHVPFFSGKEIEYYHMHIGNILRDMIENPDKQLFKLQLMSDEERNRVLYEFNKTGHDYPKGETIPELWFKRIKTLPGDAAAVVCGEQKLTYGELDARSSALALYLKKQGVKADSIVGLLVTRSLEYCVSVLAILKAGGAFLPIDSELPFERIAYMLSDSGAKAVIVSSGLEGKCAGMDICVIKTSIPLAIPDETYIEPECGPDDLAYVIYTSGSTGQPKGVQIEQHSAVHFVYSMNEIWKFTRDSRMLCAASFSFDMSIMEFLPAILSGATVVLAQEHEVNIPRNMARLIKSAGVNIFMVTPGRMELLLSDKTGAESLRGFRNISMGGDILPEKLLEKVRQYTNAQIMNFYGPTEITVCATYTDLTNAKIPNIGRPMFNVKAYILDEHKNPVPIGVPGELYIGGSGVSRGYINRPELNKERFIDNPFIPGEKLYRTGDLTRWYPQGEIEFLGRIDKQVKIRGFRIELGEIESRIMQVQGVKACAVSDRTDAAGRKFLCAYIVGEPPKKAEIKAQLTRDLPSYMIPSYFVTLEELPLSASGKVDRDRLPDPLEESVGEENYMPPETATEQILSEIWSGVLNTHNIGRDDSFFDIGGDSLSIVTVMSKVIQSFHVDISLEEVYRSPRLADLASLIDKASESAYRPVLPAPEMKDYPLSSAQQRMWVLAKNNPDSIAYNIPVAIEIRGKLSISELRKAFKTIISRHEIFRTTYILRDGELRQKINKRSGFQLDVIKCEPSELKGTLRSLIKPFDLTKLPAIRSSLIKTGKDRHILFIDMNHISGDKGTTGVFLRELSYLYSGITPEHGTLEYKDYAVWQQEFMDSKSISIQRDFWSGALLGELPLLNLHTDRPRSAVQKFNGARVGFEIKGKTLEKLRALGQKNGATLFTVMLAVYNVLLMKYTGQEDIIIGSPVSGRKRSEFEDIAGVFLNTLPLRNYPKGDLSFKEFLGELNNNFISAFANSEYPLERIISDLSIPRDTSRNPIFDTMFIHAKSDFDFNLKGLECGEYDFDSKIAKLDLTLEAYEDSNNLKCRFEYNTRLFRRATVKRMAKHLCRLADILTEEPGIRLCDVAMMTQDEIWQVTEGFNQTDLELDPGKSIQGIFEDISRLYSDKTALVVSSEKITFADLNERANRIAWTLIEKGVGRNSVVALCIRRSADMLASMLGIIKAGGGYLPMDAAYPADRLSFMLSDSGAKVLISDRSVDIPFGGETLLLSDISQDGRNDDPVNINKMEDIAYVMYTSGSTGLPKGTVLNRRGLLNFYEGVKEPVAYDPNQTSISLTTVSFDIFVCDAILPLLYGCTVVLCTEEELRQSRDVAALIETNNVKFMQATPTRMRILLEDALFRNAFSKYIEKLMLGGEMVPPSLIKLVKKYSDAVIINAYGPTETTVYSSFRDLTNIAHVTIGRPIANTRIYVLDSNRRPVPIGALGEGYISGAGVAIGYLNRDELNRKAFLPDPYWPGQRMYKTGDVCAFLRNGEIEMCGRVDHQIKIRGQRIELGEIETAICSVKGIEDAVVKDWGEGLNKYLCAYYVESSPVSPDALRAQLAKRLPSYMVPSFFIRMEELPMTLNGKVNRKALIEPERDSLQNRQSKSASPMTETEKKMARVWSRILKTENISADDNFFSLGGDSLGVIKIQAAILQYGWRLRTKDFYEFPTLRAICRKLGQQDKTDKKYVQGISEIYIPEYSHLKKSELNNVLLTGATGYLGAHILEQLAKRPETRIKCLVRGRDHKASERYLREVLVFYFGADGCSQIMKRVSVLNGSITSPDFGFNENDMKSLQGIDTVLHCAAVTDHVGQADLFYNTNVLGTKNAIDVSRKCGAALLHVSTYSVSGTYYIIDKYKTGEFSEDCFYVGQNYTDNEYIKSKYLAEEIVLKEINEGLNARIFRVGLLTGTMDGKFQMRPEKNAFANQLKALCSVGCVPLKMLGTKLEMTPVDACAQAILALAGVQAKIPVFHVFNDNIMTVADIVSLLEQNGYMIEVITDVEFMKRMKMLSKKGNLTQLSGLIDDINTQEAVRITVKCDMTKGFLSNEGFSWPVIDAGYVGRFINTINRREMKEI